MKEIYLSYSRASTDEQTKKGYTVEEQIEEHREWAERNNITIDEFFIDDGYSATNVRRPNLQKMINRIKENKKDKNGRYLIKYKILIRYSNRLIRDLILKKSLVRVFKMFNVEIICTDGSLFSSDNVDLNFGTDIIALTDDLEVKRIPIRVAASYKGSARLGNYPIGGPVPRGFKRVRNERLGKGSKLEPIEGAEETAKKLYEMVQSNKYTIGQMRVFMDKHKVFGYRWKSKDLVIKFFTNPINYGALIAPNFNSEEEWKNLSPSNLELWYDPVNHIHTKPLVSKEQAIDVLFVLDNKKQKSKFKYLFTNMVRCECGEWMVKKSVVKNKGNDIFKYYYCKKCKYRVNENKILKLFLRSLDDELKISNSKAIEELEYMEEKKEKRMKIIATMFEEDELSEEEYKNEYRVIKKEVDSLRKQMKAIMNKKTKKYNELDFIEKKALIASLIEVIRVNKTEILGNNNIEIVYKADGNSVMINE